MLCTVPHMRPTCAEVVVSVAKIQALLAAPSGSAPGASSSGDAADAGGGGSVVGGSSDTICSGSDMSMDTSVAQSACAKQFGGSLEVGELRGFLEAGRLNNATATYHLLRAKKLRSSRAS